MAGRIAISPAQLREASAAGLVDRPIRSILDVRGPMHYGDFVWNDKGVPDGPTWIRVDLASQLISVFRSGHEIGTAVILYGTDGYPTPTGKFPILAKLKDHKSSTYDDAPMPYTRRLDPRQQRPLGPRQPRLRRRPQGLRRQAVRRREQGRRSANRLGEGEADSGMTVMGRAGSPCFAASTYLSA
jgi:hypothetical protein